MSLFSDVGSWFKNLLDSGEAVLGMHPQQPQSPSPRPTPAPQMQQPLQVNQAQSGSIQVPQMHPQAPPLPGASNPNPANPMNNPNPMQHPSLQFNPYQNPADTTKALFDRVQQQAQQQQAMHPTNGNAGSPLNDLTNAPLQMAKGLVSPVINASIIDPARQIAASVTDNQQALQNANAAEKQALGQEADIARGMITRPIAETALSLNPTQQTFTPNTPVERALLGSTPVQNIEKKTAQTYQQQGLLPAVGEAVGSAVQDIPVVGGAAKLLAKGAEVTKVADTLHAINANEAGFAKIPGVPDDIPTRPYADAQKAIEDAHNAGNDQLAAKIINEQVPIADQPAMRSALGIDELGNPSQHNSIHIPQNASEAQPMQSAGDILANKYPMPDDIQTPTARSIRPTDNLDPNQGPIIAQTRPNVPGAPIQAVRLVGRDPVNGGAIVSHTMIDAATGKPLDNFDNIANTGMTNQEFESLAKTAPIPTMAELHKAQAEDITAMPTTFKERLMRADKDTYDLLSQGGKRYDAIANYVQHYGMSEQNAVHRTALVQREINLSKSSTNPLASQIKIPNVAENDASSPFIIGRNISAQIANRIRKFNNITRNLDDHDVALLDQLRGNDLATVLAQAHDKKTFARVADVAKDYNDFTQATGYGLGQPLPYRQQYGARMFFDMEDPDTREALMKVGSPTNRGYTLPRNMTSYEQAAKFGVKRKNANFIEDLNQDAAERMNDLKKLAIQQGLEQAFPGKVSVGELSRDQETGRIYKQLTVPGGTHLTMPAEVADRINNRTRFDAAPRFGVPAGDVNRAMTLPIELANDTARSFRNAYTNYTKLNSNDLSLLNKIDAGQNMDEVSKEATDPKQFKQAVLAIRDAMHNYQNSLERTTGNVQLQQPSMPPRYFAATPEVMDELKIPDFERLNDRPGFVDLHGTFGDYAMAQKENNLSPLFDNIGDAATYFGESAPRRIHDQALITTLAEATPDQIGSLNERANANKEFMRPANGGKLPFSATENLDRVLSRSRLETAPDIGVANGNVKGAIARATGMADETEQLFKEAALPRKKLSENDQELLYRVDRGEDPEAVSRDADNPKKFLESVNKLQKAMQNYEATYERITGRVGVRPQTMPPHYFEATPELMDRLGIPDFERLHDKEGFVDLNNRFGSYDSAQSSQGLQPLFKNIGEAADYFASSAKNRIRNEAMTTALAHAAPYDIGLQHERTSLKDEFLKPAAGGNLPLKVTDKLDKALTNFRSEWKPTTPVGQAVEKAIKFTGSGTKKTLFLGSPFHQAHITENVAMASLMGREPLAFAEGIINEFRSSGGIGFKNYYKLLDHYRQDGTLEYARNMGMTLPDHSGLDRFINGYALSLAKIARDGGIEEGSQTAVGLGRIYNHLLGRENAAVEAVNPTLERMVSYFSLAPHYLRTQLKLVYEAMMPKKLGGAGYDKVFKFTTPGGAARSSVVGPRLFGALLAITASAIVMNRFPTWQQAINEAGLNPNNTNPNIAIRSKNAKGERQVMNIPTDPLGLAFGFITDPQHFFQSRESPALSFGTKIATNKNWNGQPLVDTNQPNAWPKRIIRAAENSFLPIGVQNFTNLQHNPNNPNIEQGLGQEIGLRLKTDPNDPQVQANQSYSNMLSKVTDDLKKGPFGQFWAQQFANLHPANTTDASGMKYPTPFHPTSSLEKYNAYIAEDANGQPMLSPVFDADKKLATATPGYPASPLYSLNGNGVDTAGREMPKALVALEYSFNQDPAAKKDIMDANGGQSGWLAQYEKTASDYAKNYPTTLTNYFKSLGWSDQAINDYWSKHPATPDPIDQPQLDKPTTDLINQYYNISASGDSTGASQFFTQHANILGPAFDQIAQHTNAVRASMGELQLQAFPHEDDHVKAILDSMPSGSDSASKKARAQLINNNPDVSQYLANVALYQTLDKGSQFKYKMPANMNATEGENINNGGKDGQTFLKDVRSLGMYDIGKDPLGNYAFMQNGQFPNSSYTTGQQSTQGSTFKKKNKRVILKRAKVHHQRPIRMSKAQPKKPFIKYEHKLVQNKPLRIQPNKIKPIRVNAQ